MITGRHDHVTGIGQVVTGVGNLSSVLLTAGAGANATLVLYDGVGVSATILCTIAALAATSVQWTSMAYPYTVGIYATIAGAGATAEVVTGP